MIDNKAIYDDIWGEWVDMKIYGPASRWLHALIKDHITRIDRWEIDSVLDVGCGEGTITHLLRTKLPASHVTGIDFSVTGIECAKHAYGSNIDFIHDENSDALHKHYDLVTAFEVLEHVEDWKDLLGRMARSSNKYLMLSFPTGTMRPFEKHVGHLRNFKRGEVEEFLEGEGFVPVNVFYAGFPFYNPLYRNLCNAIDSGANSFTRGRYTWKQKLIGTVGSFVFTHLSTRYHFGDQFCGLFVRKDVL